ncbi:hypothetical protein GOC91_15035 [Sinorhizobium medicae]|uniref:Uncharacterized protein n=2 Tax=Sinorhizobium medicae TaxID=110321 RepID=A6UL26_SINMW|nr:hypothetical protein Smed_5613 [Sinorhizobium medicae WSM419]MDX0437858.1 hypothetical protein [Sinorhizobium medicae]MDX0456042.1 hypothetical protein [Sinorhizobium medicae]MDX0480853.1 hypothetical protein [Sinorhizobium medicae]MDX0505755.1 hypothetical protein [Sinorhizobium medicae]
MMLRRGQGLLPVFAAFAAGMAMLFYAFCAPATHSPRLHSAHTKMVAVDSHSHEHGDHSHDDLDLVDDTSSAPDHHHADHTHEKAELVAADDFGTPLPIDPVYSLATASLSEGPPNGIERPPRMLSLS